MVQKIRKTFGDSDINVKINNIVADALGYDSDPRFGIHQRVIRSLSELTYQAQRLLVYIRRQSDIDVDEYMKISNMATNILYGVVTLAKIELSHRNYGDDVISKLNRTLDKIKEEIDGIRIIGPDTEFIDLLNPFDIFDPDSRTDIELTQEDQDLQMNELLERVHVSISCNADIACNADKDDQSRQEE